MDLNVWSIFERVAERVADRVVALDSAGTTRYGELLDRSRALGSLLATHGLGVRAPREELSPWESGQSLVAVLLHNRPEYVECVLGSAAARAAAFNVNYRYQAAELRYLLEDSGAEALVFQSRFAPVVAEALHSRDDLLLLQVADDSGEALIAGARWYESALADAGPFTTTGHTPDDLYVVYTGGTTGQPKGTLWRQGDLWMATLGGRQFPEHTVADLADLADERPGLRVVPNAPLMHGAAQWMTLASVLSGGSVAWSARADRFDPDDLWRTVESTGAERTMLIGEAMARPAVDALASGAHTPTSLRSIILGGAATTGATKARLLELLPGVAVIDVAGSTETGGGLTHVSSGSQVGDNGVFRAGPSTVVLDPELREPLRNGDERHGFLATSGPIPLGYLGDRAKTEQTFVTTAGRRWAIPGDRAALLEDGRIRLLGRDSMTINSGGEKIFAEEVEQALLTHPAVADVIVVGRESARWGQEVAAVVELSDPDVLDAELTRVAALLLARYKLPKSFTRVSRIRRSPAGKADYGWAREVAAGNEERQ